MALTKKRTRMYEPWGYREENNYQGSETIRENDLSRFFAEVEYKREDNKIHFSNKDGEEVGSLNVNDFIKSDQIVERAWYEDGKIYIKFTNGDLITIDVKELLDENEFADGLQVINGVVSVLKDPATERWLTVSSNGVKVSGIQAEIDRLDRRIDDEIDRATSEEERIEGRLNQEIEERILDVDEEETRAINEESRIESKLDSEITRSKDVDDALDTRIGILNDALTSEKAARESADLALSNRLNTETSRATNEETALNNKINGEIQDRKVEAVASAEYVKAENKMYFKNISGETLSTIDTSDFAVDGMIEDVRVEDGKLVIEFNTASGKETIEIPLTQIFNPADYYTKTEIDNKVSTINSNVAGETTARESGDNALQGEINTLSTTVAAKANTSDVDAALALKADASAIADMATKTWVGEQGFLTEHQDLSDYAKTADVNAALDLKADKTEIPTDFYTKGEIDGKEATLQSGIDANTDAIALKADKTEIPTDFYTQEEVNALMSQLLTRIENLEAKESIVVADTAAEVAAAPAGSDVVIASTEAIQALTAGTQYNTVTIVGGNANNGDIKTNATDKVTIDGVTINGDKGASNGRVLITADTVDLKNITIESGSTAYNVFEGTQSTATPVSTYNVSNLTADNTELNHNILNIYAPADDAVINVKDVYLNLNAENSNLLRLSNVTNATGVTVNLENIEWTYENSPVSSYDWAGLIIYQAFGADIASNGDTSKLATWTFNFKNCKYNGEPVNDVNMGEHSQVIYGYGINHGGVSDLSGVATINFE